MKRATFLLCLGLLGIGGCNSAPSTGESDSAKSALETTLSAWKQGETVTALVDKSPSIQASDYRWAAGFALVDFRVGEAASSAGFDRRFAVDLTLKNPKGKAIREKAFFQVTTHPAITVIRDPES